MPVPWLVSPSAANTPQKQCIVANVWSLATLGVMLPLLVLQASERRERWLFERTQQQQPGERSGSGVEDDSQYGRGEHAALGWAVIDLPRMCLLAFLCSSLALVLADLLALFLPAGG